MYRGYSDLLPVGVRVSADLLGFPLSRLPTISLILLIQERASAGPSTVLLSGTASCKTFGTNRRKTWQRPRKDRTFVCVVVSCNSRIAFVLVSETSNLSGRMT